jgi:hypothetical protein
MNHLVYGWIIDSRFEGAPRGISRSAFACPLPEGGAMRAATFGLDPTKRVEAWGATEQRLEAALIGLNIGLSPRV